MKKIAIVGAGPTGIYTLFSLLQQQTPLSISIFEQADGPVSGCHTVMRKTQK